MTYNPNNPNGQATAANSSPVVLASDKIVGVAYNTSSVVTGSFTAVTQTVVAPVAGYSSFVIFIYGTFSVVVTYEYSPDSTNGTDGNWFPLMGMNITTGGTGTTSGTITTATSVLVQASGATWMRARCSTYTSGTANIQIVGTSAAAQAAIGLGSTGVSLTSTTFAAPAATIASVLNAKVISAAGTNATLIKATAAKTMGWQLANTTAAWKFVKLYVKATVPTVGTDTPTQTIPIAPNGYAVLPPVMAQTHGTGIGYAITGGYADLDTTVVAAGDVVGTIYYV